MINLSAWLLTTSLTVSMLASTPVLAEIVGKEADVKVPGTNYDATGEVSCSMGQGQPMGSCPFGVIRQGNGTANVTITKPDGKIRVIFFEEGNAIGFDQSEADPGGELSASQENDLLIIHLGDEHYEIPDIVIFGD